MSWGRSIRESLFWTIDRIKGSPIKKVLLKTKSVLDMPKSNSDSSTKKLLADLLQHATHNTRYYKNLRGHNSLDEFPLINKNIIRDNLSEFISEDISLNLCKKVSTSGSTGTPFSVYQDCKKIEKNHADNIYFSNKSNYRIGDHLVYIKIWPDTFSYSQKLQLKAKNIQPHSVYNLSNNDIQVLIDQLNKSKNKVAFIGYASAFQKICWYLDTQKVNPINFNTSSIITISESLSPYARASIKKYFGVEPFSRYSNNENGIIAQQVSNNDLRFRINTSSYKVEIFDLNEDKKIGYGEKGRIVITDLYNYAAPLIRYDTGDVGIMELDDKQRPYFKQVLGRKLDLLYDTKGNLVPEHLSAKLCNYGQFKQFQLVQKHRKEYLINLNTKKKVDEEKLISEYKGYFGDDANININYVDEIPLLRSGKRREVINEYYTKKTLKEQLINSKK